MKLNLRTLSSWIMISLMIVTCESWAGRYANSELEIPSGCTVLKFQIIRAMKKPVPFEWTDIKDLLDMTPRTFKSRPAGKRYTEQEFKQMAENLSEMEVKAILEYLSDPRLYIHEGLSLQVFFSHRFAKPYTVNGQESRGALEIEKNRYVALKLLRYFDSRFGTSYAMRAVLILNKLWKEFIYPEGEGLFSEMALVAKYSPDRHAISVFMQELMKGRNENAFFLLRDVHLWIKGFLKVCLEGKFEHPHPTLVEKFLKKAMAAKENQSEEAYEYRLSSGNQAYRIAKIGEEYFRALGWKKIALKFKTFTLKRDLLARKREKELEKRRKEREELKKLSGEELVIRKFIISMRLGNESFTYGDLKFKLRKGTRRIDGHDAGVLFVENLWSQETRTDSLEKLCTFLKRMAIDNKVEAILFKRVKDPHLKEVLENHGYRQLGLATIKSGTTYYLFTIRENTTESVGGKNG